MLKTHAILRIINPVLFSLLLTIHSASLQGEPIRPELEGEIDFQEETQTGDQFTAIQDRVIEYFKDLQTQVHSLSALGTASLKEIGDNEMQYLNAAYLYCSINQGTCPLVLDALLEIDVINSKLRNSAQCPTLKHFWKLWLKNDMERRYEYQGKLGLMAQVEQFKKQTRPRYIRCDPTVQQEISSNASNTEYFKARYREDSAQSNTISQISVLLESIKKSVPNVFIVTGSKSASTDAGNKSAQKKKSGSAPARKPQGSTTKKTTR